MTHLTIIEEDESEAEELIVNKQLTPQIIISLFTPEQDSGCFASSSSPEEASDRSSQPSAEFVIGELPRKTRLDGNDVKSGDPGKSPSL